MSSHALSLHKHPHDKGDVSHLPVSRHVQSSEVCLFGSTRNWLVVQIFQSVFPSMIGCIICSRDNLDVVLKKALGIFLSQYPPIGMSSWALQALIS